MVLRIAVKRLSAVETDPARSNQHEVHAGELRRELELPDLKWTGPLDVLVLGGEGEPPIVDASTFTLYNARENRPARSAEWRIYFATNAIVEAASEQDLLLLYRHANGLRAVIARTGTNAEADLLRALELGDDAVREHFRYLDVPVPNARDARDLAGQLTLTTAPTTSVYAATDHTLFRLATRERTVPGTADMANAAAEIVRERDVGLDDPDIYLDAVMTAETELYFAVEEVLYQARLDDLTNRRPNLAEIMDFSVSLQQSRRSRRGQSLQNHFRTLLRDRAIPFTAQCETERGERPDFLVPGCTEYHDRTFPAEDLRLVACKSTAKERWRQVLNEAERIQIKYLLTVDRGLTASVIDGMIAARLQPFLPRPTIDSVYMANANLPLLSTVASLLERLLESMHRTPTHA